jgi:hypothetical protein
VVAVCRILIPIPTLVPITVPVYVPISVHVRIPRAEVCSNCPNAVLDEQRLLCRRELLLDFRESLLQGASVAIIHAKS